MKLFFALVIISLYQDNLQAANYYVSSSGNDANSGTLTLPWKTVTYASANTNPGDTIYVKAGLYNENVVISKSGVPDNPVVFIGYKATPGDDPPILVNSADPYTAFSPADMPTFDGGNRAAGIGLNSRNQKFLKIRNFQIQNFRYGLIAEGASQEAGNNEYFNINLRSIGDISASYSGYGILLGSMGTLFSNNNSIDSCLVVNSAAEGISINGNYNTITGSKVYCNENTSNASTDYYFIVTGSYNQFTSCFIERTSGLSHAGHGYTAKTNAEQVVDEGLNLPAIAAEYNIFRCCVAKNMGESFCVRHRTARYNLFYHCKAIGTHTGELDSPGGEGNGVVIRDGASDNIFDGCVAEDCNSAIRFNDTVEDGDTGDNPTGHPGNNNKIINSLAYNCYIGVYFDSYSIPSDAGDNTIANCTFYKTRYLHYAGRSCKNMKYIGNIYYGCLPNTPGGYFKGNAYAADIVPNGVNTYFKKCDFYNIEGGMPAGFVANSSGSIAVDPLFKDPAALDFHLLAASPCIDAAATLAYTEYDYDSVKRPQGIAYDMGSFEYAVGSLPITLMDFKGRAIQTTAVLTWTTSSEQNNKLFKIQRSTDGIHFNTIGIIDGHGTSSNQNNYEFTDAHPALDHINYYRLIQKDIDGQSNLSKIIALHFESSLVNMALYPNPAHTNLLISVPANEQKLIIKIFDANGKKRYSILYNNLSALINIDISRLIPGVYRLVTVKANGQVMSSSFIKE